MPQYRYYIKEPAYTDFNIFENDTNSKFGTLRVKPSSILWKPANAQEFKVITLEAFADFMNRQENVSSR